MKSLKTSYEYICIYESHRTESYYYNSTTTYTINDDDQPSSWHMLWLCIASYCHPIKGGGATGGELKTKNKQEYVM